MPNALFSLMPLYVHNLPAHLSSPAALGTLIERYGGINCIYARNGYAYVVSFRHFGHLEAEKS